MSEVAMSPSMAAGLAAERYGIVLEGVESPDPVERMRLGAWVACQAAVELGSGATADAIRQYADGAVKDDWAVQAVTAVQAHNVASGMYGTIVPERRDSLAAIAGLVARYRDGLQAQADGDQQQDLAVAFRSFAWTGIPGQLTRYRMYPE